MYQNCLKELETEGRFKLEVLQNHFQDLWLFLRQIVEVVLEKQLFQGLTNPGFVCRVSAELLYDVFVENPLPHDGLVLFVAKKIIDYFQVIVYLDVMSFLLESEHRKFDLDP